MVANIKRSQEAKPSGFIFITAFKITYYIP